MTSRWQSNILSGPETLMLQLPIQSTVCTGVCMRGMVHAKLCQTILIPVLAGFCFGRGGHKSKPQQAERPSAGRLQSHSGHLYQATGYKADKRKLPHVFQGNPSLPSYLKRRVQRDASWKMQRIEQNSQSSYILFLETNSSGELNATMTTTELLQAFAGIKNLNIPE